MNVETFSNGLLQWLIRGAGLFWLLGAFMLFRQIRMEMALDSMTANLERAARELQADAQSAGALKEPAADRCGPEKAWMDRDDRLRRGWIAGQAVVLAATALAMVMLHSLAAWLVALLVLGQGAYFLWREHAARHAPSPEAADHARPSASSVNAGWFSFFMACLVWIAGFRGLLA